MIQTSQRRSKVKSDSEKRRFFLGRLISDCENYVYKMVGDNGRDMTLKECRDYVNELAPKAPAAHLTKQFTNVDVPNTSRLLFSDPFEIMAKLDF